MRGITKVYPGGVVANDNVFLDIYPGEVLALLGENGAGKTTLVSIIAGVQQPTRGEIIYQGQRVRFKSPRDAARAGIALAPQNPRLVDAFTVAENIALAARLAGRKLGLSEVRSRVKKLGEDYGIEVDPDARVWRLSMGEKQRVEILKALILNARLMLLDEPTTHLSPMEANKLLDLVRRLATEGRSIVLITHRLREVLRSADRIAVMRKGRLVGVLRREEATQEKLLHLMFGERMPLGLVSRRRGPGDETVLVVEDLWIRGEHGEIAVRGVSLNVRRGEIVGVAGVAGNGQRELFEALVGLRRPYRGRVLVAGVDVTNARPSVRGRLGVAIIPEERLGWALVPGKSLVFNTALGLYSVPGGPFRGFVVDWGRARAISKEIVEHMKVRVSDVDAPVESMSGGNMQRFIVGRELSKKPSLVLAMNPTSGLDVDAAEKVRGLLAEAADSGTGVLLISEDLDELLEVADRIVVMSKGRVTLVEEKPFNVEEIAAAMTGVNPLAPTTGCS